MKPPALPAPDSETYRPEPPLDFIVDLRVATPVQRSELLRCFPQPWFIRHRFPRLEGRIAGEQRYVSVGTPAMDLPDRLYDQARFVARLFEPYSVVPRKWTTATLAALVDDARKANPSLGVEPCSDPASAVA